MENNREVPSRNTNNNDMELEKEEELVCGRSDRDADFDTIIGHIEDIIMEPNFYELQHQFLEEHCHHFEDKEENKLIYMDIFKEYTDTIENYIEQGLKDKVPGFSMENFLQQLKMREAELDGEVFDMLLSFSDFLIFKEMLLDYKAAKEGKSVDLSSGICISSLKI